MMDQAQRLRAAREAAGFATAADAAERFGWNYPTYAGHENGHRGMRSEAARRYSRAFNVESAWLMFGTGEQHRPKQGARESSNGGLAEPDAVPFIAASRQEGQQIEQLAALLTPNTKRRMIYEAGRSCPAYAILKGDLLVIDVGITKIPEGRIAVVTLADMDTGDATTVLRQAVGDGFAAPFGEGTEGEHRFSRGVLGLVAAVMRRDPER